VALFRFGREPTPEERAAQEALHEEVPEELIARAIGLRAEMAEGEIARLSGGRRCSKLIAILALLIVLTWYYLKIPRC